MNLDLDPDQSLVIDAVDVLLSRHAGPARSRQLGHGLNRAAIEALAEAGYLDIAEAGDPNGYLAAVLVVEQTVQHLAGGTIGARCLVAPYVGVENVPDAVGLAMGNASTVRYGSEVDAILMLEPESVRLLGRDDFTSTPVQTRMSYPIATVSAVPGAGQFVGDADAAARMRRAWRVLLTAEISAAMTAAIEVARAYVSVRTQFGRHIGSLQAVQHRLAQAHVSANASMWLARDAAWHLDDDLRASLAACYATSAIQDVFDAVHQVVGAIGFTTEFDLHLWSMRLPVLAAELGGPAAHASDAFRTRYGAHA
jgi:hypothetical protein